MAHLVRVWRKKKELIDNPAFDPNTMDPDGPVDPKILQVTSVCDHEYVEQDDRTVQRNIDADLSDEMEIFEIDLPDRGKDPKIKRKM